jgi:hypothetical protein
MSLIPFLPPLSRLTLSISVRIFNCLFHLQKTRKIYRKREKKKKRKMEKGKKRKREKEQKRK